MGKRKTTEEFIEQAKVVHGDKYDYSKVEYKGSQVKVCIILPNIGEFWQSPQNHLQGCCPEMIHCGRRKTKKLKPTQRQKKYSLETFIEKAIYKHKDKYDYSKVNYINSTEKVCIVCPEHGLFWQAPAKHLQGFGCPTCGHTKRLDTTKFVNRAITKYGNTYSYEKTKYVNLKSLVIVTCKSHGDFYVTPKSHLEGKICPQCKKLFSQIKTKNHKCNCAKERNKVKNNKYLIYKKVEWLRMFKQIHGNKYKYLLTNCTKQKDYMQVFCKKHNYWYPQSIVHHLHGSGCPICSGGTNKPYTTEEFIIKAKEVHGALYDYKKVRYINKDTPVEIICEKHGSFWQKPHNHINGGGCQTCKATKKQLKLFNLLKASFPKEEWLWEYQTPWLGLQRFDIYNKRCNLAIEYNGEQHYQPVEAFGGKEAFRFTVERDKLKMEKCENNNCTLYIVKYDEFNEQKVIDDISKILNRN